MNGFDSLVENRIQAQMSTEHLTHEERSVIASLKLKNRSITEIATIIDRHRTTVWRELKLNSNPSGTYTARAATKSASQRVPHRRPAAPHASPRNAGDTLRKSLRDVQWSPEEIRNRMIWSPWWRGGAVSALF
jgi:transposase, IS30 family